MMGREIKFRAWHPKQKRMHYLLTFEELDEPRIEDVYDGFEDGVWMQYTGLKDKNGKEIYEGDIVRIPWFDEYQDYVCQWSREFASFEFYNKRTLTYLGGAGYETIKIIGNIYENPELEELNHELWWMGLLRWVDENLDYVDYVASGTRYGL